MALGTPVQNPALEKINPKIGMATLCCLAWPCPFSALLSLVPDIKHDPRYRRALPRPLIFHCFLACVLSVRPCLLCFFLLFPLYQLWLIRAILLTPRTFILSKPMRLVWPYRAPRANEKTYPRGCASKGIHSTEPLSTNLQCSPYWHWIFFLPWRLWWWGRKTKKTKESNRWSSRSQSWGSKIWRQS